VVDRDARAELARTSRLLAPSASIAVTALDISISKLSISNGRALEGLHRRADAGDFVDADRYNDHLASLLAEREVIARAPTWPWAPETLRGFATALVLPVALWFVYWVLEQVLA
jgi:hypothetical protein